MKANRFKRACAIGCSFVTASGLLTGLPQQWMLTASGAGSVVINEVCTKNTKTAASDGQFYDFIELYNTTQSAVSVGGYYISDDPTNPKLYQIPAGTTVPAKGYQVIYCGVDETSGVQGTPFGLNKSGETLTLADSSGNVIEKIEVPALNDDYAFGRVPDGGENFSVLNQVSPGQSNPSSAVDQIVVLPPSFSKESGFYSSDFSLTLSAASGCTIYYTLDGSDPSPNGDSQRYSSAIPVQNVSNQPNVYAAKTDISTSYTPPTDPVKKAMIVRAVAVDQQGNISQIATNTYFVGYTSQDLETKMRVVSLVTDPDNLFDNEKGIYVLGKVYENSRTGGMGNPMMGMGQVEANYTQSGREWERPAYFTLFDSGNAVYSAYAGIRIHGAYTRANAQKSFNLYARSDYGTAKFDYDFFDGQLLNIKGKPITSFDKLTLRNGGNDNNTKVRDRLNQTMLHDRSFGTEHQVECIVFLDGEYWGTYNICEKIGKEYISDHFKVKEKDVCMIKTDELSDGSDQGKADYEELKNFAKSATFTDAAEYQKLKQLVDVDNFADYMAAEVILGNSDFGNNNYALWKTETVDETKQFADGKWRFILFDTEYGAGLYGQSNVNSSIMQNLQMLANQGQWLPKLFINLLKNNAEFRALYLRNYFDMCNENFKSDKVLAEFNKIVNATKEANIESMDRFPSSPTGGMGGWDIGDWGDWNIGSGQFPGGWNIGDGQNPGGWNIGDGQNPGGWNIGDIQNPGVGQNPGEGPNPGGVNPGGEEQQPVDNAASLQKELDTIQTFWSSRAETAKKLMLQWLGNLVSQEQITVELNNDASKGTVQLNTLNLDCKNGTWSGTYASDQAVYLTAKPAEGYAFDHWEISGATASGSGKRITVQPDETAQKVSVRAVYKVGVDEPDESTTTASSTAGIQQQGLLGDVDCSGKVVIADAILLARFIAEDESAVLTAQGKINAELTGNSILDSSDLSKLLQYLSGSIKTL